MVNALNKHNNSPVFLGLDLSARGRFCEGVRTTLAGTLDESREIGFCAIDRAFAIDDVSSMRGALSRRIQSQTPELPGPIPVHGFCTAHVSRELARDRSMLERPEREALPHGHSSQAHCQEHFGRRQ